jgi:hypothetical protein
MTFPCKQCGKHVRASSLSRCQSQKCRPLGDAFCPDCLNASGTGFYAPRYCRACHPDTRDDARPARVVKPKKPRRPKRPENRLQRLRKALRRPQWQMAEYMGMSLRQYQTWEADDSVIPTVAAILAARIADEFAPHLVEDWPEGTQHTQQQEDDK